MKIRAQYWSARLGWRDKIFYRSKIEGEGCLFGAHSCLTIFFFGLLALLGIGGFIWGTSQLAIMLLVRFFPGVAALPFLAVAAVVSLPVIILFFFALAAINKIYQDGYFRLDYRIFKWFSDRT